MPRAAPSATKRARASGPARPSHPAPAPAPRGRGPTRGDAASGRLRRPRVLRLMMGRIAPSAWGALNVLPVPGAAAMWLGYRNPHAMLWRRGLLQCVLVLLGSYPLVLPGAVGFGWAVWDGVRIARAEPIPAPPRPEPAAPEASPARARAAEPDDEA